MSRELLLVFAFGVVLIFSTISAVRGIGAAALTPKAHINHSHHHSNGNTRLHIPSNNVNRFSDKQTTSGIIKGQGVIYGTNHDDYIIGSEADDTILGKAGNDVIQALGGDDTVYSGLGDDTVYGGDGNNQLFGEDGNDNLIGGPDSDMIVGGFGDDHVYGNGLDDVLVGGPGADYFDCGDGIDSVLDYNPSQGDIVSNNCENVNTVH